MSKEGTPRASSLLGGQWPTSPVFRPQITSSALSLPPAGGGSAPSSDLGGYSAPGARSSSPTPTARSAPPKGEAKKRYTTPVPGGNQSDRRSEGGGSWTTVARKSRRSAASQQSYSRHSSVPFEAAGTKEEASGDLKAAIRSVREIRHWMENGANPSVFANQADTSLLAT